MCTAFILYVFIFSRIQAEFIAGCGFCLYLKSTPTPSDLPVIYNIIAGIHMNIKEYFEALDFL